MAKMEMQIEIITIGRHAACGRAVKALKDFEKALDDMEKAKIEVRTSKPKKWWQFWKK